MSIYVNNIDTWVWDCEENKRKVYFEPGTHVYGSVFDKQATLGFVFSIIINHSNDSNFEKRLEKKIIKGRIESYLKLLGKGAAKDIGKFFSQYFMILCNFEIKR